MSTPTCHRTIGPVREWNALSDEERARGPIAERGPCLGSRCAMWVPEILAQGLVGPRTEGSAHRRLGIDRNYNPESVAGEPSGRGWCADNLRCAPWADPAKEPTP